ncbi:Ist1 protein [Saccharomycopsis crataegensis]|uniref:Ist1 protein n=1 Tax=Saccharomycopsis crataegensis TaxID=43959 RepID=A0AAV5QN82_9ASCO|nr:Ist1 protein [Saccharomycopsis crataegensis]
MKNDRRLTGLPIETRLKVALKMSISKLRFVQDKKTALAKQQRRSLADLLSQGKEQSARIRVENVIREDIHVELCEMLELYCELLLARISLLDSSKECDPGLEEAVKTIIYAAPHSEIKELMNVKDILGHRFGPEFYQAGINNTDDIVPKKVVDRVIVKAPSSELVSLYLKEIAQVYEVPFSELTDDEDDLDRLVEEAAALSSGDDEGGDGLRDKTPPIQVLEEVAEAPKDKLPNIINSVNAPIKVSSPAKTSENRSPSVKVPHSMDKIVSHNSSRRKSSGSTPTAPNTDIESLRQRFAALKRGL